MSYKEICPVCDSCTSSIYSAFLNCNPCPSCGTSYETIRVLKDVARKKEDIRFQKLEADTIKRNEQLERENAYLREKVRKIEDGIWHVIVKFDEVKRDLDEYQDHIASVQESIKEGKI